MNIMKNKTFKLTLSGIAIFAFGMFLGYQLNYGKISSIQGFLFNAAGSATDANATNANATNANATDANATDANATNANATNANAQSTDNIIYLQNFHLLTLSASAGEKVNVSFEVSGACLNGISVTLKNKTNGTTFSASVKSLTDNPYIILPSNLTTSSYIVTDVLLTGINSDNTTFSKHYSSSNSDNYVELSDVISITAKVVDNRVKLNSISLSSSSSKLGDSVSVVYSANKNLKNLTLVFSSSDGNSINVYVKDLNGKAYFEIPTTVKVGNYTLIEATLTSNDSTTIYSKEGRSGTEKFDFNSNLEIIANEEDNVFIYNNDDITNEIITKLYNANSGTVITINADNNSIISEELFNSIKGKNKDLSINYNDNQIIFNGINIKNSKSIDASIDVFGITKDSNIGKLVDNGVVVSFADNGNLPGIAKVRIKSTQDIDNILNGKNIYVYFYNSDTNNFCEIEKNVAKTADNYYEFNISHNSEYVLVNEKLDEELLVKDTTNIVSFQKSNKIYLLLIGIGILAIVATVIIIVIVKKKNKK